MCGNEEPSVIGTAQAEQMIVWPKHGDASRSESHGTFLQAASRAATPGDSLQVPTILKPTS